LLADGDELGLVLALGGDSLHLRAVLGLGLGPFDLTLLDGLDSRRVLAPALFFHPARFLHVAGPALFRIAQRTLFRLAPVSRLAHLTLLMRRLGRDSLLLEIHQFF
jgi:hypothetical protein